MKSGNANRIVVVLLLGAAVFIVFKYNNNESTNGAAFFPLKERSGAMAQSEETRQVKRQFADLMKVVRTNPDDIKSRIALATLYIQEARVTGNHTYYDMAAIKYVNEVLEHDSLNFEALTLKALISLSQHHFSKGLAFAEKASAINPDNAFVRGMLVDGHVELGNYAAAVKEADKMMSLRPDLRSYSRVSYLREIHGDYAGAIDAMKMAVDAGPPGDEATEWARVHLGELYETTGDLTNAEMNYMISLQNRPAYAYGLAGLGRIASASKEFDKAIAYFNQADLLLDEHSFKEELADVYEFAGEKNKADSIINYLINALNDEANKETSNGEMVHNADGEFAHVYLKAGNYDKALQYALADYNRRPSNIHVNEILAWVYYNKKEYGKALQYLETAMKTKNKNPVLLCRAGIIYAKNGNRDKAKLLLGVTKDINCNIPASLKEQGLRELQTL